MQLLLARPTDKPVEAVRAAELLAADVRAARDDTDQVETAVADAGGWAAHTLASALAQVAAAARLDPIRAELAGLLTAAEWAAAAASTLDAHYTDPVVVAAVWRAVQDLGFTGGPVLQPGCGSGNFIGAAPAGAVMTGWIWTRPPRRSPPPCTHQPLFTLRLSTLTATSGRNQAPGDSVTCNICA